MWEYARRSAGERLWIIPVDALGWSVFDRPIEVHVGGISEVIVSVPDVLAVVLVAAVPGFVAVHNHPSGNPNPSQADYKTARELRRAADACGLVFYDDVIVAAEDYFSFREETTVLGRRRRIRA